MKPEEKARQQIDKQLQKANWIIQDRLNVNLGAGPGVAIREFPTKVGPVDYALFANRKAIGVVEAKPAGATLSGVAEQTAKYIHNFQDDIPHISSPLPFAYESTDVETYFRDDRDPNPLSRRLFSFHKSETLLEWANQDATLRARLQQLPPLITSGLRDCQIEAITNLDLSFKEARPAENSPNTPHPMTAESSPNSIMSSFYQALP